jgi:hypothetical protein
MGALTKLTDAEVQAIADEVLVGELGALGLDRVEARSGTDADGDPALFLKLLIRPEVESMPEREVTDARMAFYDRLIDLGEDRFAYFRLRFTGQEIPGADRDPVP